jgi:simple sugar transport system substrate-binding protein
MMESSGIPLGFNILTGALYEADTAPVYHGIMGGN